MGKAEIIEDLGDGLYTIKRLYAGRDAAQSKIVALNTKINELNSLYSSMPETTEDEIFAKHIVRLQVASLEKQVIYITNNFPDDIETDVYCADFSEGLAGEIATIDIPGEVTELVNIRPAYDDSAVFALARDGQFWPSIAVGPWTSFLNKCLTPGWQRWKPIYRYAWIVEGSVDYTDNTCAILIQPAFSTQQNLDVNQGDGFGAEVVEEEREVSYFYQPSVAEYPGFQDFADRYSSHPIITNTEIGAPVEMTDEQYANIFQINYEVNTLFQNESDQSGYGVGEYFDIMYDPATDKGDCEDYSLTKMHRIIEAGILPAKNLQLIFCNVVGLDGGGHAVAGIQTTNKGFLILDNRYPVPLRRESLSSVYAWEAFQIAGSTVVKVQRLKGTVPIEYMSCNAGAFEGGEEVIIEFTGQDFSQPKVIGFKQNPSACGIWSMFGGEPLDITAYQYKPNTDSWRIKADSLQHFSGLYYFEVPEEWADANNWQHGLVWPIHIRYEPIVTKTIGNIFSFGGWFDNGDYFEDQYTSSFAIDTCEKFNPTAGVWSRRNKDDYVGRSCGAGWAIDGKSYIACGAFYDDRFDTFYPHVELDPHYIPGDYEDCDREGYNIIPTPESNSHYHPDVPSWQGYAGYGYDFDTEQPVYYCSGGLGSMGVGAHSYPPPDGAPSYIVYNYKVTTTPAWYQWLDASPAWDRRWYVNQLFGGCLRFDDESNAYTQRQETTPTMMMGSFQLGNVGHIVGGTTEEISDIIRSADTVGMTNDTKKYNAATNSWAALNGFYEDRLNPSGFDVGGKGYVFSGYSKTNHSGSIEQVFGHESFNLFWGQYAHPQENWYGSSGGHSRHPGPPSLGVFPGAAVSLFCTNIMHEYDGSTDIWMRKNDASTPIGNCKYKEFYNWYGTVTVPFFYTLNENNCLVRKEFEEAQVGGINEHLYYHELSNPGPFDIYKGESTLGFNTGDSWLTRKLQHIYSYPAGSEGDTGYITSDEYMASYKPVTDSYSIKDEGIKDHLSGAMA